MRNRSSSLSFEKTIVKSKTDVTVVFKDGTEIKAEQGRYAREALRSEGLGVFLRFQGD